MYNLKPTNVFANAREKTTPYHYPGSNYIGPGTHIIDNIYNNVQPTSLTDRVAMYHDIDYLGNDEPIRADMRAILSADNSLEGIVMKAGLGVRSVLDGVFHLLPFKNPTHVFSQRSDELKMTNSDLQHLVTSQANLNGQYRPYNPFGKWSDI